MAERKPPKAGEVAKAMAARKSLLADPIAGARKRSEVAISRVRKGRTVEQANRVYRKQAIASERAKQVRVKFEHRGEETHKFKIQVGTKPRQVVGSLAYYPEQKAISVTDISMKGEGTYGEAHEKHRGKVLTTGQTKQALVKLKRQFPKAEVVKGIRVTGVHEGTSKTNQSISLKRLAKKALAGAKAVRRRRGPIGMLSAAQLMLFPKEKKE